MNDRRPTTSATTQDAPNEDMQSVSTRPSQPNADIFI